MPARVPAAVPAVPGGAVETVAAQDRSTSAPASSDHRTVPHSPCMHAYMHVVGHMIIWWVIWVVGHVLWVI